MSDLKKRNESWFQFDLDTYWDVALCVPIHQLITTDDQGVFLQKIVKGAVDDLLAVGIVDKLASALNLE